MSGPQATCPQCAADAYSVCGRKDCTCRTSIPAGELPLIHVWALPTGFEISEKLGNIIWKVTWAFHPGRVIEKIYHRATKKYLHHWTGNVGLQPGAFMMECEKCPYCGYTNSFDWWAEREMEYYESQNFGALP